MKKILVLSFAILLAGAWNAASAQESLWKTLAKLTYKKQYDEMLGFKVDVPVFNEEIKKMEGKVVTIKGYIIPVEGYKGHKEFILSAFPYNMCFFCGGAGPETVMEVFAKEPIKYTAEPVTLKGKLELNSSDINRLIYGLREVEQVKEGG
jgi:hypothetical protein